MTWELHWKLDLERKVASDSLGGGRCITTVRLVAFLEEPASSRDGLSGMRLDELNDLGRGGRWRGILFYGDMVIYPGYWLY